MPAQEFGQEQGVAEPNETVGLTGSMSSMNQAPTLALGSLAQVGLGTRAETPASLAAFESLMGTPAQGILGFADDSTPQYSVGRVQADAPKLAAMERPVNWAIPLAWENVSLADVAAGKQDAAFTAMAETIAEHQSADINPLLYVRLGWEANNAYPWKISSGPDSTFDQGLAADYVGAFQHVATLFRSVDDRFRIEWNQNYSKADANGVFYDLNKIYPGDEYVDVVGVDAYNVSRFSGQDDPVAAWDYKANAPFGLDWFSSFAAAHGKPLALTEWGIDSDGFGHYVDQLQEFARTNNVIHANYWNADARTNGDDTLTDGSKPATAAAIAEAFGAEGNSTLIAGEQSGLIVEAGVDGNGHALAGTPSAQMWAVKADPDAGDAVTFDTAGWTAIDASHFQKNGVYGSAVLDTEVGTIAYTLDNSRDATDALADKDVVTDDFSITLRDQAGAFSTQTASFVVRGANDAMLAGGAGNDVFDLDKAGDQVVEKAGAGEDSVRTGFTHVLNANVENLELLHTGNAWGTGNELDNALLGNVGDNMLRGLGGADVLRGMAGNDALDGGEGSDVMYGGMGDDVFNFDSQADSAVESVGQGTDTVRTGFSDTLAPNVENLELLHAGDAAGTGNELDNSLLGNVGDNALKGLAGADVLRGMAGNDRLDGGAGADVMYGGEGSDVFYFGNVDQTVEPAGKGSDTILAGLVQALGLGIENLERLVAGHAGSAGNGFRNIIVGNADDNEGGAGEARFNGGTVHDMLSGRAGADRFVFDVAPSSTNVDEVRDFDPTTDRFELSHDLFANTSYGELAASAFAIGHTAADTDQRVIYNDMTGALFYDSDGAGGTDQFQFASLSPHLALSSNDFFIV